jgi:tetratricopeptide (TPR) repeat protein
MKIRPLLVGGAICVSGTTNLYAAPETPAEPAASSETTEAESPAANSEADALADRNRASARQLATDASNEYRMGQFDLAYDHFNRAFRLVSVPALGVWSARSLRQLGRLVEASERYREVLGKATQSADSEANRAALGDAQRELDELLPRIPNLTIQLVGALDSEVEIRLDGELVDPALIGARQRVNPGLRHLVATRGTETVKEEFSLTEGANHDVTVTFQVQQAVVLPAPVAAPRTTEATDQGGMPTTQVVGIALMGGGALFLGAGIVTTILALGEQADLQETCDSGICPADAQADVDQFNTMKSVSTAALIGGAALGALGATLYFTGSPQKQQARLGGYVSANSIGLLGAF